MKGFSFCALWRLSLIMLLAGMVLAGCSSNDTRKQQRRAVPSYDIYQVNVRSSLNVRESPTKYSAKIGSVDNGQRVSVMSISNGWAKISVNGQTGYISSEYITLVEKAPAVQEYEYEEPRRATRHVKFSFYLEKLYYGTFLEDITQWLCDSPFWVLLIILAVAGVMAAIGVAMEDNPLSIVLFLPAKFCLYALAIMLAFCADWIGRLLGLVDIWGWILGAIIDSSGSIDLKTIILVLVNDWIALIFMGGACIGIYMAINQIFASAGYVANLVMNILSLPIVIMCLGAHSILFLQTDGGYILEPGPNQIVLYAIVVIIWFISIFMPAEEMD